MRDRPILFSGSMVRAILDGRKTQTRRVVKPQPVKLPDFNRGGLSINVRRSVYQAWNPHCPAIRCPYGQRGDRLWVRETWGLFNQGFDTAEESQLVVYRAGTDRPHPKRWRPSIHMPRWASRITLEVTGVRVERLQDISEADAAAEGIEHNPKGGELYRPWRGDRMWWEEPFPAFRDLWTSINGHQSWAENPWVWVVEFRRLGDD